MFEAMAELNFEVRGDHSRDIAEMFEAMVELIFEVRGGGPCDPTAPSCAPAMISAIFLCAQVRLGTFSGGAEKCVDIALAVEMLHYATEPNALDVAGAHLPY